MYVAIPVAAPIALGGFYSFNGMSFYEVMDRKIRMLFANHPLTYISTEGEAVIKEFMQEEAAKGMKDKKKKEKASQIKENKKEFEVVKKKTKKMVIGAVMAMVLAAVGIVIYRMKR